MGKLSDADWQEMSGRLRARAARLMRQLDAGAGYREQIERELAKRLGEQARARKLQPSAARARSCATANDADARFCKRCGQRSCEGTTTRRKHNGRGHGWSRRCMFLCVLCVLCVLCAGSARSAQFQMPDAKADVRHPAAGHRFAGRRDLGPPDPRRAVQQHHRTIPVELHVGRKVLTVKTDEPAARSSTSSRRARRSRRSPIVDGERLESQEFPAPAQGGIRLMLVATDTSKRGRRRRRPRRRSPDRSSSATQSRIVIEPGEEAVDVFYLLDIANNARAPVNPPAPFVFDMPAGAAGARIMEGSSPQASARAHVTVQGPFPPGRTFVQVACGDAGGAAASIDDRAAFPGRLEQLAVVVKKVGDDDAERRRSSASSARCRRTGEMYIAATGGAVAAGQPIELDGRRLPASQPAPRTSRSSLAGGDRRRRRLGRERPTEARRRRGSRGAQAADRAPRKLFNDLVRLEHDRRGGRVDERRYAARREELVAALEQSTARSTRRRRAPSPPSRSARRCVSVDFDSRSARSTSRDISAAAAPCRTSR